MNLMIDCTETRGIRRVASLNSEKVSLKYSILICLFKSMFIFSSPALTSLISFFFLYHAFIFCIVEVYKQTINQSVKDLFDFKKDNFTMTSYYYNHKCRHHKNGLFVDNKIANIHGENKSIKIIRNTSIYINNVKNTLNSNKIKMFAVNIIIKTCMYEHIIPKITLLTKGGIK